MKIKKNQQNKSPKGSDSWQREFGAPYTKYVGNSPPSPVAQETRTAQATTVANEVWVNTRSGKYWELGSRFYGKTKQGEFMPELDALDRGYSPAGGTGQ